jgi:hypothetical protein
MDSYDNDLNYQLALIHDGEHDRAAEAKEFAKWLSEAWPMLQRPENRHRLERIMEILENARQRRAAVRERFGL